MAFWEITRKDLHLLIRDKRAVAVLVLLPLVFIAILGLSTDRLVNPRLKVGIIDRTNSDAAQRVIDRLKQLPFLSIVEHQADADPQETVQHDSHHAVLDLGPEFSQRVDELNTRDIINREQGRLADGLSALDVELLTAFDKGTTPGLVNYIVTGEVIRSIAPDVLRKVPLFRRLFAEKDAAESIRREQSVAAVGAVHEKSPAIYREIVPSYTVMFVFFLVNIMGRSFIQERDIGTLRRLRMAPVRPISVLIGKTLPFFVISIVQTVMLFSCGKILFGMPLGQQPLLLIPMIVSTSLAATGLGLLFSTLVRTDSQVSAYGNLIILTMAGISGCFMPRDWLPETMQKVSLITPHAWALTGFHELLGGKSVDTTLIWRCCGVLLIFASVFVTGGWLRFRAEND